MKKWLFWIGTIAVLAVFQSSLRSMIGPYYYQIVILVGIEALRP